MNRRIPLFLQLLIAIILLVAGAAAGVWISWSFPLPFAPVPSPQPSLTAQPTSLPSPTIAPAPNTPLPQVTPTATATLPPAAVLDGLHQQGVIIFSMSDGANYHLFAFHPQFLLPTRLTNGPWDDVNPAVSPDGTRVAFGSRPNGYWDIFILDLASGKQTRLTDTPEYDGAPTWSPDGQFLAYETRTDKGTQLFIRSLADPTQAPVQLTDAPGQSFSPAWSPKGREIAFMSTRSGDEEIWLARLDRIDDRFINVSRNGTGRDRAPRWSPDGEILTWASDAPSTSVLMGWDERTPERIPAFLAYGDTPVWGPTGELLLAEIREPNQTSLTLFRSRDFSYAYAPYRLPGRLQGIDWHGSALPDRITAFPLPANAQKPAGALFSAVLSVQSGLQKNRFAIVPLKDVNAPTPYLQDAVDESFQAMRQHLSREIGWDFLGQLEQAYLPVTTPSQPGLQDNWLYTGRALAINTAPYSAGWLALVREDIDGQTFWRVYLRCLYQDASQGRPLNQRPWDLNARFRGDPRVYDQGGEYGAIPEGYWFDFTELAARYGWERLPAQINWRTYYPGTLFGQFVMRQGLTWQAAMAQVYPPEVIATPTLWVTLTSTLTPTPTPYYQRLITPSLTSTITLTPTRRPTLTPATRVP